MSAQSSAAKKPSRPSPDREQSPDETSAHAVLFDADGTDRELPADEVDLRQLSERQLLWADLQCADTQISMEWLRRFGLDADPAELVNHDGRPMLQNFGDWFVIRATVVTKPGHHKLGAQKLTVITGHNFVITLHPEPLVYLTELQQRERGDTQLGVLTAEAFTTALLDWLLSTYFDAVAKLEAAVDRLEVQVLTRRTHGQHLPDLAQARRSASRLRRMLVPHRAVFGAMARPDFRPGPQGDAEPGLRALNERFERALEAVENARDLVVGSFELFATRTAQRTNDTMRVLTFVTVLMGTLAVVAGVLGMNFETPLFKTGTRGFTVTIACMLAIALLAVGLARWRRWW